MLRSQASATSVQPRRHLHFILVGRRET
jgi:hypothetical protein